MGTSSRADDTRTAPVPDASRRERILVAALEIFSERGYEGTSTRRIAERAGANHGLIRYHFSGKEALWKAAVDRAVGRMNEALGDGSRDASPLDDRDVAEHAVRRFVRFAARHPAFIRMMNDEGKRESARMRWLVERHVRPIYERVERRLLAARASGSLPALSPVSLHYILVGAGGLIFSQAPECEALTGVDPRTDANVEAHADAVVALLLGPAPQS